MLTAADCHLVPALQEPMDVAAYSIQPEHAATAALQAMIKSALATAVIVLLNP